MTDHKFTKLEVELIEALMGVLGNHLYQYAELSYFAQGGDASACDLLTGCGVAEVRGSLYCFLPDRLAAIKKEARGEASKLFTADKVVKIVRRAYKKQVQDGDSEYTFATDDLKDRIITAIRKAEKGKSG